MHMMQGMGDQITPTENATDQTASFEQTGLRIVRGMEGSERDLLLSCWRELWLGTIRSHRQMMTLEMQQVNAEKIVWTVKKLN